MKKQLGFSMLEVLIAITIFSVGLLGLSRLQMVGLSSQHSANIRSTATSLAYDMVDRMRANMAGVNAGNYNNIAGSDNACHAVHYDNTHSTPNNCTPNQLAQDDVFDWKKTVAGTLVAGEATVCLDSTPDTDDCDGSNGNYAVRISWRDKPKNEAATTKTIAVGFQP